MRLLLATVAFSFVTLPLFSAAVVKESVKEADFIGSSEDIESLMDNLFGNPSAPKNNPAIPNEPKNVEILPPSIDVEGIKPTTRNQEIPGTMYGNGGQLYNPGDKAFTTKQWNGGKASTDSNRKAVLSGKEELLEFARSKNPFTETYSNADKSYRTDMSNANKKNVPHWVDNASEWKKERSERYADKSMLEAFDRRTSYDFAGRSLSMVDINRFGFRYSGTQGAIEKESGVVGENIPFNESSTRADLESKGYEKMSGSYAVNLNMKTLGNTSNGGSISLPSSTSQGVLSIRKAGGDRGINKR